MGFNKWILTFSLLHVVSSQIYLPCNIIPRPGCICLQPQQPIVRCEAMGLKDIPEHSRLPEAHTLSFRYNNIDRLDSGTFNVSTTTKVLILDHNTLSDIESDALEPFESTIERIDLNDNFFTKVPRPFHPESGNRFTKLTVLNLSGNQIWYFNFNNFVTMPFLKVLLLDRNPIRTIYSYAGYGLYLEMLGLGVVNTVHVASIDLTRCPNLKSVRISGAQSDTLSDMHSWLLGLRKINHLFLHDMNLEDDDFESEDFPGRYIFILYTLSLQNNDLTQIPPQIVRLKWLKKLDLSGNKILEIRSRSPKRVFDNRLEEIRLANNSMQYVNKDIFLNLYNLKILDLRDNNLQAIGWSSSEIREAFTPEMTLQLGSNPWICTCRNQWLRLLVHKEINLSNGHLQLYEIYNTLYCTSPRTNNTELIVNVPREEFACTDIN